MYLNICSSMQLKNRNNTIFNKNDTDADYDPP